MSSGQKSRRPEFFPRMKVRGARRRREYAHGDASGFTDVMAQVGQAVTAAAAALSGMWCAFTEGLSHVLAAEGRRLREYLLSDRYQLDLIERRFRHDPIAWSNAVRDFYVARAHRELDDLQVSVAFTTRGIQLDPWQEALMAALYNPDQIARIS